MSELRVAQPAATPQRTSPVSGDGSGGQRRQADGQRPRSSHPGAEELALALSEPERGELTARYEQDGEGNGLIHIIDSERDEVVAVVTPEELRELADQTGLPPGLLVQVAS
jgi:hypothetical protein